MEKITINKLIELGFIKQTINNKVVFTKDDYGLLNESGSWLIWANHSGSPVTGLSAIDTIEELHIHYFESTGNKLNEI